MNPLKNRCLVLNQDFSPLDIIHFHRSITLAYLDKVRVVEYFDWFIRGASGSEYPVPAVVQSKKYVRKTKNVSLTRSNLLLRDDFTCQYCKKPLSAREATIDHVVPKSRFRSPKEATRWTNVVCCCLPCNSFKGDQLLEKSGLTLDKRPYIPTFIELFAGADSYPKEWIPYVRRKA